MNEKEFMKRSQDVVVEEALHEYRLHIASRCLKNGMSYEDILEIFDGTLTKSDLDLLRNEEVIRRVDTLINELNQSISATKNYRRLKEKE